MAYGFTGVMMASVMKERMNDGKRKNICGSDRTDDTVLICSNVKVCRIFFIVCEASPDAEFYELTDENIDHFFGE